MSSELVGPLVRLILTLPVVLGLAYLVLKYGLARRYSAGLGNRRMKLVEQLPLGPRATLSLIDLGGRYYLIAHQDNSISLIKELDSIPGPEEIKVGDIVELTPQSLAEANQFHKVRLADSTGPDLEFRNSKFIATLGDFARKVSQKVSMIKGYLAGSRVREKGDRNFEG